MQIILTEPGTFPVSFLFLISLSTPVKYSAHNLLSVRLNIFLFGTDISSNTDFRKQIMEQNYLNRNLWLFNYWFCGSLIFPMCVSVK